MGSCFVLVLNMYMVYILQSEADGRYYYGFTEKAVTTRLEEHNQGKSLHTHKYRPWKLVWFAGFLSKERARNFERYLKSGSGHAFSRKRLIG
ncbi:MAG: GIY-YIG nuclease family protein [Patescibacteria group bacterium]